MLWKHQRNVPQRLSPRKTAECFDGSRFGSFVHYRTLNQVLYVSRFSEKLLEMPLEEIINTPEEERPDAWGLFHPDGKSASFLRCLFIRLCTWESQPKCRNG